MFYTLILENQSGEQLNLTATANQYMTSKIDGLNPPAGTISTSTYAGMDGSYLNNAFIEKRNVVISFQMRGIDIEKRRHLLYRVVKPSRYIKVFYKTAGIDVYTEGYVETCEISNFDTFTSGQISIICPDPYWYSTSAVYAYYSQVTGAFHFPFPESDTPFPLGIYSITDNIIIQNDGDETGFTIRIEASADETVPEIAAVTPTIYNADTGEYLQIKGEILKGDVITITTKTGNKTVILTRNGVDSNIINRLVSGSTWLSLREGKNTFHVQAVRGVKNLKVTLMHRNAFLGV
ncbi:phage tail domain-containing protein [Ruminococcus sp.]|uniref:phage distal tail protein n=1 Tax=Ruminococcus sp. TaxID=41978 RepID=UPI0025F78C34|nr:phage tail domain-containing protein [Ruminococcus sp.]